MSIIVEADIVERKLVMIPERVTVSTDVDEENE